MGPQDGRGYVATSLPLRGPQEGRGYVATLISCPHQFCCGPGVAGPFFCRPPAYFLQRPCPYRPPPPAHCSLLPCFFPRLRLLQNPHFLFRPPPKRDNFRIIPPPHPFDLPQNRSIDLSCLLSDLPCPSHWRLALKLPGWWSTTSGVCQDPWG